MSIRFLTTSIVVFLSGASFVVLSSMGDPSSIEYLPSALREFLLPLMGTWVAISAIVLLTTNLIRKINTQIYS